jgi:hypothetical protein
MGIHCTINFTKSYVFSRELSFHLKLIGVKGDKPKSFIDLEIMLNGSIFRVVVGSNIVSQQ